MTGLLTKPNQLWNTMPGWGIAADLTPPELIDTRRMKRLRHVIALCLLAVVLLCAAGYAAAYAKHLSAASSVDKARARTTALNAEAANYAGVTRIKATTSDFQTKVAGLMKTDVDLAALLTRIRQELPKSMALSQVTVTVNAASATTGGTSEGTSMNTSGATIIGTVTLTGYGRSLNDLPLYVDGVSAIAGVVDVVPTSNQNNGSSASFSVTLNVTDKLYTHRFDVKKTGGN